MSWRTEFSDYPPADMPAVPASWVDVSWRNDSCPSFSHPASYALFVDYADRGSREFPEAARFCLYPADDRSDAPSVETESWDEMLAALAERGLNY